MINRVVLVGRLVRDPEIRRLDSGTGVCSFTIAVDNRVKNGANKTASFIPCTAWSNSAEYLSKYSKKGSLVGIDGRLQQRSYERKDGTKASVVEVVVDSVTLLDNKGSSNTKSDDGYVSDIKPEDEEPDIMMDLADDDLPF